MVATDILGINRFFDFAAHPFEHEKLFRREGVTTVGNFAVTFKFKNPEPPAEGWNPDADGSWLRQLLKGDADDYVKLAGRLKFE